MTACYFIRMGRQAVFLPDAIEHGYIGVGYSMIDDLTGRFPDQWTAFNKTYIPRFLELNPGKSRVAAGLACGTIWTVGRGMQDGDYVVTPNGAGDLKVGQVTGGYQFAAGTDLMHRRPVSWRAETISRDAMSAELRRSVEKYPATLANITVHLDEITSLLSSTPASPVVDSRIEDPVEFALEKYLEAFLVDNWSKTALGKEYDIYTDDEGHPIGQQYPCDTGPLDILAISKDKSRLLVVELKRGKASDSVVGQIQRYMGYVKDQVAESTQSVHGVIIALEDDLKIRRALSVATNIAFYRYTIDFKLTKA